MSHETIVEMLLNTLEVERASMRRALLGNVVDQLRATARLAPAAKMASDFLDRAELGLTDSEFQAELNLLRRIVRGLSPEPAAA